MPLPNIFDRQVSEAVIDRLNKLTPDTQPLWGKMSVDQMLAHCNVTYEMTYTDKHPKPGFFMRVLLKLFVKNSVINETPYKKNGGTAPAFIIKGDRDFALEKQRLTDYIRKTQELGASHFEKKESISFGVMSAVEWNNQFYKHLDHHLSQFGV
jgi:hypothetical protein